MQAFKINHFREIRRRASAIMWLTCDANDCNILLLSLICSWKYPLGKRKSITCAVQRNRDLPKITEQEEHTRLCSTLHGHRAAGTIRLKKAGWPTTICFYQL